MKLRARTLACIVTLGFATVGFGQAINSASTIGTTLPPVIGNGIQLTQCAAPDCGAPACGVPDCGAPAPTCGAPCGDCGGCDSSCGGGCGGLGLCDCDLGDAWTLSGALHGDCPPCVNIGGWFSAGYHSEDNGLFNSRPDNFALHQGWLYAEKAATCESPFGFRADMMYGIDADDTQSFGNEPGTGTSTTASITVLTAGQSRSSTLKLP